MLPPLGSLIVGPCPECQQLVLVFCGRVLPLDKEIMMNATFEEKREHLMSTLVGFLEERVGHLLMEAPADESDEDDDLMTDSELPAAPAPALLPPQHVEPVNLISSDEVADFVRVDLSLMDNPDYFKAIFG